MAVLATAPVASAAKKNSGPKPKITRVTPMRVTVGKVLTIRGQHFKAKARKNTVIFRANNGRTAFAKPRRASKTKLVVRVPASVARLLTVKNSKQKPTRLKLRVLAGKFSAYTTPAPVAGGRRRLRQRQRQHRQGLQGRLRPRQRPAPERRSSSRSAPTRAWRTPTATR